MKAYPEFFCSVSRSATVKPAFTVVLALALAVTSLGCTTTETFKDRKPKTQRTSDPNESFTLFDKNTKVDRSILKRGAKARASGNSY